MEKNIYCPKCGEELSENDLYEGEFYCSICYESGWESECLPENYQELGYFTLNELSRNGGRI